MEAIFRWTVAEIRGKLNSNSPILIESHEMKKRAVQTAHYVLSIVVILSALGSSAPRGFAQSPIEGPPIVLLSSDTVSNGNVLLLQITGCSPNTSAGDIRIEYGEKLYPVYRHPTKGDGAYFTLVGISYRTKPGPHKLTLNYFDSNGGRNRRIDFKVVAGKYKKDVLKVDSRRVDPNQKDRERASRERQEVKHIYAGSSHERFWEGPFQLPVENEISSRFGNRRVFNGKLKSYHNGLDFRSPKGTPVYASNSGIVKVAKNLFYSGNAVVIDHGTQIFTIYAHLSKIKIWAGQRIRKGQLIGLSGATGRVSGPHLHWGVKINGIAVDPLHFVEVTDNLVQQ